jgi:hypothetical protein
MNIHRNPEPGRQAVLWLATAFVILIGAASCAFIVLSAVDNPSWHLTGVGVCFAGLTIVLMRFTASRDKNSGTSWLRMLLFLRQKSDPKTVLRIGRRKSATTPYGTNSPPTLESIRDAAEQNATWVPHGVPPDRQRPSR